MVADVSSGQKIGCADPDKTYGEDGSPSRNKEYFKLQLTPPNLMDSEEDDGVKGEVNEELAKGQESKETKLLAQACVRAEEQRDDVLDGDFKPALRPAEALLAQCWLGLWGLLARDEVARIANLAPCIEVRASSSDMI
jgi:hypothetical protein